MSGGLFADLGAELVWQVVLTGFALVAAVVPAVLLLQRRSVSPTLLALGPGLAALVVLAMGRAAVVGWPPEDPEQLRLAHTTFTAGHLLGPLTFGPVAALSLGLLAFAGGRAGPRRWGFAVAIGLLAVAAAAVVIAGGYAAANPVYAWVRGVAYVGVGLVAAVAALAGGEPDQGGPDAAAGAAAIVPLVVAVGEASERGLVQLLLGRQAPKIPADRWATKLDTMLGLVDAEWTASLAALGIASLVPLVGIAAGWRSPQRAWAVAAAAGAIGLAWLLLRLADLGPGALRALSALCPAAAGG